MEYKEELRRLTGGMNQDVDPDYLPEGDYIEAWNCIGHRSVNSMGRLYNLLGTEANTYSYGGGGTQTVIGKAFDRPNHTLYYFVHSTGSNDFIVQINLLTKTNTLVVEYDFGFSLSYPIDAVVESGVLIWTDNYNPPRRLEIQRAINTTAASGSPQYPAGGWTDQTFDCVWYPPNEAPQIAYGSDSNRETNNIQKKIFQFVYRYKYYDKGRSVFGPYSEILIPTGEEDLTGKYIENPTVNNKIVVQVAEGTDLAEEVEVFVRELRTDSDIGYWRLCRTFDSNDTPVGGYYSFDFVNDRSQQIDIDEALRPFDYIPRKAKTVTTVRDSQVVFGNYTADYDSVVPDVTLSHTHYLLNNTTGIGIVLDVIQVEEDFEYGRVPFELIPEYVYIDFDTVYVGSQYTITFGKNEYTHTPSAGDNTDDVIDAFIALMSGDIAVLERSGLDRFIIGGIGYAVNKEGHNVTASIGGIPSSGTLYKQKSWKKGALLPLGILYRDAQGRPCGSVAQNASTRYYLPFSTEEKEDGTLVDNTSTPITTPDYYTKLDFVIAHEPPQDARTWQWVYLKNNLAFYDTYLVNGIKTIAESADNKRIGIDVNSFIIANNAASLKTQLEVYTYTEGDRLRFISEDGIGLLTSHLDFAIHGVHVENDEDGNSTEYVLVENFDFASFSIDTGAIVEIYRPDYEVFPAEDEETPSDYDEQWRIHYFEMGPVYEVYEDSGTYYHRGDTQDQTAVQDAEGTIDGGDVYQRIRFYFNSSFPAECNSISDFFDSQAYEKGRLAMYLPDMAEKTYENGLVYGGQNQSLHDDTNYMFSFDFDGWMHDIPKEHGAIYKILTIGDILKVFQATKVSSVYIGKDAAVTASGEDIIRTTDKVLGTIRPSTDNHGTVFPESILSDGTNIYFFDMYERCFVANTQGGNVKLSALGMGRFFDETCNTLIERTLTDIKAYTAIDRFGNVILTLRDATAGSTINWGILFDPVEKKWKGFLENPGDFVTGWNKMISFVDGALSIHNEDSSNHGLILGTQVRQSIKIATAAMPGKEKTFLSVVLDTDHNKRLENVTYTLPGDQGLLDVMWSSEYKGDLLIPATKTNPNGKQTRLLPLRWFRKRNELFCTIPPDMYDPEAIINTDVVASGSIANGSVYHVDGEDITYDGDTYSDGDEFTGTAVTTYTGSGSVRLVSEIEALSLKEGRRMKGTFMYMTIRNKATHSVWIRSIGIKYI